MDMFRQIAPRGIVNKHPMNHRTPNDLMDEEDTAAETEQKAGNPKLPEPTDNQSPNGKAEPKEKNSDPSIPSDAHPEVVSVTPTPEQHISYSAEPSHAHAITHPQQDQTAEIQRTPSSQKPAKP
jgi:hypothetical protein